MNTYSRNCLHSFEKQSNKIIVYVHMVDILKDCYLYMKFYCPTLHIHCDIEVSKILLAPMKVSLNRYLLFQ